VSVEEEEEKTIKLARGARQTVSYVLREREREREERERERERV
jgi:hypothetical protein